jgi:hypothetical protein
MCESSASKSLQKKATILAAIDPGVRGLPVHVAQAPGVYMFDKYHEVSSPELLICVISR